MNPFVMLLCTSVLVVSCASSPEPTFFVLFPDPGARRDTQPLRIEVRRPTLPRYLDRPYIVERETQARLTFHSDQRWGAPLDEMVQETLVQNLAQRLSSTSVYSEQAAPGAPADVFVDLEFQHFEVGVDRVVTLVVQVDLLYSPSGQERSRRYELTGRSDGPGTEGIVRTLSKLLSQLTDALADQLAKDHDTHG